MAKSIDGLSKLIAIYCGVLAMRDCWEGVDEETKALIESNSDLARMMEIAGEVSGRLKQWQPDDETAGLIGSLEKELNEKLAAGQAG